MNAGLARRSAGYDVSEAGGAAASSRRTADTEILCDGRQARRPAAPGEANRAACISRTHSAIASARNRTARQAASPLHSGASSGADAPDTSPRLDLAAAQDAEHLPAAKERSAGGKVGEVGQREQQDDDALQRIAAPVRFSVPTSHSVLRFKRTKYG
jgi:hypothetical protein